MEKIKIKAKRGMTDPYGHEKLFEASRQARLQNPSRWELAIIGLLTDMGVAHERQYRLGTSLYAIHFYLTHYKVAIELDEPSSKSNHFKRADCRPRKRALCAALEIGLVTIHHSELEEDLSAVMARINAALAETQAKAA